MRTKYLILVILSGIFGIFSQGHSQSRDLSGKLGDWDQLHDRGFNEWIVNHYSYDGHVADGGSLHFTFTTKENIEFGLLVANPEYWTDEELNSKVQVFYILEGNIHQGRKLFKVSRGSKEETILIQKFSQALKNSTNLTSEKDSKMLEAVIQHLQSRQIFPDFLSEPIK